MKVETAQRDNPTPALTVTLVAVNLAVAFLVMVEPSLNSVLAFVPAAFYPWSAVTSMFLHSNVVHLLGNMVFLATVGPLLEFNRGRTRFGVLYIAGGLAGVLSHWGWVQLTGASPEVPLTGASAAIACLLGYATVVFFSTKVPLLPRMGVPVWAIGILWLALQMVGSVVRVGETGGGVAYWAHVSGFLLGLILSLAFRVPHEHSIKLGHTVLDRLNNTDPQAVVAFADRHLATHPSDVKALKEKAEALDVMGRTEEAVVVLRRIVKVGSASDRTDALRYVRRLNGLHKFTAMDCLKLGESIEATDGELARALVESVLTRGPNEPQRPHALLKLAQMLRSTDPSRSAGHVDELESRFALHPVTDLARAQGLLGARAGSGTRPQ